jgi:SAM-dependent methyltransferase
MNCRHCGARLQNRFLDLGHAPPSNAYLERAQLDRPEVTFPLRLHVCDRCWLVQTEDYAHAEDLFNANYAYFSSTSRTWLAHAARYFEIARARFSLDSKSLVVEIACNDGYLLRHFVKAGIPCLGIEPASNTAAAAEALGIPVRRQFFTKDLGAELAEKGMAADLIVGNNVYAHVPDINDFTTGLKAALKPGGAITLEFPHVLRMIEGAQFDTAYHEHFSYLSLYTVNRIFEEAGLRVFDVEQLSTHGGSLRIFGCHADDTRHA